MGSSVFLEATLENSTKGPIVMELVSLQPHPHYRARQLGAQAPAAEGGAAAEGEGVDGGPLG